MSQFVEVWGYRFKVENGLITHYEKNGYIADKNYYDEIRRYNETLENIVRRNYIYCNNCNTPKYFRSVCPETKCMHDNILGQC